MCIFSCLRGYKPKFKVAAAAPINFLRIFIHVLGDPEVTANIYFKSRNLPNTDTQKHSTDLW